MRASLAWESRRPGGGTVSRRLPPSRSAMTASEGGWLHLRFARCKQRVGAGVSRPHRKRTAGPLAHRTRRTARRRQATRTARDAGCAAKARRMATGGIPTEPGGAHARAKTASTGWTRRGADDETDKRPSVRRAPRAEYRRRSGTHRKGDAPRRSDRTRTQSSDCGAVRAQSIGALPCGAYRCGGIPRKFGEAQKGCEDWPDIAARWGHRALPGYAPRTGGDAPLCGGAGKIGL